MIVRGEYAKVICDSVSPARRRLISVEARYSRWIHAELLTHRDRGRNAASSRAVPFYRTKSVAVSGGAAAMPPGAWPVDAGDGRLEYVVPKSTYAMLRTTPFFPEFVGDEMAGMQAGAELTGERRRRFEELARRGLNCMLDVCKEMHEIGAHKSVINRYLEPWSYITVVMTATEWKNFFRLRCHPAAERHFNRIANLVRDAIAASTPRRIEVGDWHLPYVWDDELGNPDRQYLARLSAARSARTSYLNQDGIRDVADDLKLFDRLLRIDGDDDVIHASALEHPAQCLADPYERSGPYRGWKQLRKFYPNENVEDDLYPCDSPTESPTTAPSL